MALIAFALFGLGAVIVAFQFWREFRRDPRAELFEEIKREGEADR